MSFLLTRFQFLKGVGPTLGSRLHKEGISTFWDALSHLPKKYDSCFSGLLAGLVGKLVEVDIEVYSLTGRKPWKIIGKTPRGECVELLFFHKPRISLAPGAKWRVRGILEQKWDKYQIVHPTISSSSSHPIPQQKMLAHYDGLAGVSSVRFSQWIRMILEQWPCGQSKDPDCLFANPLEKGPTLKHCFSIAHFPSPEDDVSETALWRQRLAYEELLAQQLAHLSSAHEYKEKKSPSFTVSVPEESDLLKNFGYSLTPSQEEAWSQIGHHLANDHPMLHLLNGDVGSGKTIIAFLAMLRVAVSGSQTCLMAPTEILARQHFSTFSRLLPQVPVRLIIGGGKTLGDPEANITIGTHALLYDRGEFTSLSLVVVDEQQRFGVMQRLALLAKGQAPHLLFLSATPIPRTFELALWGHMTVSRLDSRRIEGHLKSYLMSCEQLPKLEQWMRKCVTQGERVYWVCPTIEAEGVEFRYDYWSQRFPDQVGFLHGRLSSSEKEKTMTEFREGTKPLLVSTTVIEVGVHVPEASSMIIEESHNFGLSQLHQLRGRVGRDSIPGHCFFLYRPPLSSAAYERLDFMRKCHDGFEIAEHDWRQRGGGKHLGVQQSGFSQYRFLDFLYHSHLVEKAKKEAQEIWGKISSPIWTEWPQDIQERMALFHYHSPEILRAG
jgi:ATP-dependent DNA helicase RecG